MPLKKQKKAGTDHSAGVSELIGAILLITITVMAVSVIGVILLSQQGPQEIPNINFMTGTNAARDQLYLYHNGGDTLTSGEFAVVLDGQSLRTDYSISDGSSNWSVGKNLVLSITTPPKTVGLVYTGGRTGNVLLRSASSNVAFPKDNITPDAMPVVPTQIPSGPGYIFNDVANITNSSYFVQAIQENVSAHRISFYKNSLDPNGGLAIGTIISLRVKDTQQKSMIVYGTTLVKLNNTDIVTVKILSQTKNFKTFGIAPQIWELATDKADLTITRTPPVSSIVQTGVSITHTWIDKYELVTSTLEIDTRGSSVTALTVNNIRYLPVPPLSTDSSVITIKGAKPLPVGLFVLIIDDSQKAAYLVGTADEICVDANCKSYGLYP